MSVLMWHAIGAIGQPAVWFGVIAVLDAAIAGPGIFVGRGSGLLGLLAAGPLLACARGNGRVTALIAAYAIALCAIAAGITGTTVAGYRLFMVSGAGLVAISPRRNRPWSAVTSMTSR